MKVVLDTNVVVSSFLMLRGKPAQIMEGWRREAFEFIVSEQMLTEYRRVLGYERTRKGHGLSKDEIDEAVDNLRHTGTLVAPDEAPEVRRADPDDNRVLECAVAGGADYIVSGDAHLLALKEYEGIPILSPAAFLLVLDEE